MDKFDPVGEAVMNSYILLAGVVNCNHNYGGQFDSALKKMNAFTLWDVVLLLGNYSIEMPAPIVITHYNNSIILGLFIIAFLNNKILEKWKYQLDTGSLNYRTSLQCNFVNLYRRWDGPQCMVLEDI